MISRKKIKVYKIFWYHFIPYVIAELENIEWKKIKEVEKKENFRFTGLQDMYNSNGNWYILEGLDYFWFNIRIFTNTSEELLYNDSMHFNFNDKSDKEKFIMLKDIAKNDIKTIWNNFFNKKII